MIRTIQKEEIRETGPRGVCEEFKTDLPVNTSIHL